MVTGNLKKEDKLKNENDIKDEDYLKISTKQRKLKWPYLENSTQSIGLILVLLVTICLVCLGEASLKK